MLPPTRMGYSSSSFSILDILRVVAGLLFFNAFASWWFTSSSTWGYDGKWIDPRFLKFKVAGKPLHFSLEDLALYNGSDPALPIYIAINGSVYDVSASPKIYGPKGPYRFFSGRDAARAFVTGCFQKEDEFTYDLRGIDPEEAAHDIRSWQQYYETSRKYWSVGTVDHKPLTGDPPAPCVHVKYPQ